MKSFSLPAGHYAASWKVDDLVRLNTAEVTELGQRYVDAEGQAKEDLLLQLCQRFHGYIMKYLVMICRGHVPVYKGRINSDSAAFLAFFMPKGTKVDLSSAKTTVSGLHLAFKGMDSGEVYDVLMQKFLEAVAKYDPAYTDKVKQVVECIDHELSKYQQIRACDVDRHLDLDSDRYLRLLTRRGFLTPVKGEGNKISGWVRSQQWPPPDDFFTSGAIGLAYYLQTWFRYYVQQWVEHRFAETEAHEGVYSYGLRDGGIPPIHVFRASNTDGTFLRGVDGEETTTPGKHLSVSGTTDSELSNRRLDVSQINITWVDETSDPLFRDLTRNERYLLYLFFNRGMKPKELGEAMRCSSEEAKTHLEDILTKVRSLV